MRSTLFSQENNEVESDALMALQNPYMLRSRVTPGRDLITRKGAMVAYQGNVEFKHEGARDAGALLRKMVSSDDQPLMRVFGHGDVFFAHHRANIHLIQLEGEGITINGTSLLAFQADLGYELTRLKGASMLAGGFWNAGLIDRVIGYIAPSMLGSGRAALEGEAATLADMRPITLHDVSLIGPDIRIIGTPGRAPREEMP